MAKYRYLLWPVLAGCLAVLLNNGVIKTSQSRPKSKSQVSYKETTICETTPGVKSYSGYVSIPPTPAQRFSQNLFFWFFESRNKPKDAPLVVWMNGGPGAGSTDQAISLNGPCITQPDGNSTRLNPWSWNNDFNLIYIDQPVQSGFSYDVPTPGVKNMRTADIVPGDGADTPEGDMTWMKGVYTSQNMTNTPNTTALVAKTMSKFFQLWFEEFEQYRRDNISIWTWSYGGHFAPAIAAQVLKDKEAALKKQNPSHHIFGVDAIGIINGLFDLPIQMPQLVKFPNNNTYGLHLYNDTFVSELEATASRCLEQSQQCEPALQEVGYDPLMGEAVPPVCFAGALCWNGLADTFDAVTGRNPWDFAHHMPDGFPQTVYLTFLNQDWVVEHLGAKINYIEFNPVVDKAFAYTGDAAVSHKKIVEGLLDAGVQVSLLFGDRDYRCDWVGGEALSLSMEHTHSSDFRSAGYEPLRTTQTNRTAGYVRQAGGLSFIRVLDSGHLIPFFHPEVAYDIVKRVTQGRDIATGTTPVLAWAPASAADSRDTNTEDLQVRYATRGPNSVWNIKNTPPPQPPEWCNPNYAPLHYVCDEAQIQALADGTAIVKNGVVVEPHQ